MVRCKLLAPLAAAPQEAGNLALRALPRVEPEQREDPLAQKSFALQAHDVLAVAIRTIHAVGFPRTKIR